MITLYSFGENFGVADPSPFVLKVDAYLRMAGLEYQVVATPDNLRKAPKGKLPFITDDDKTIADSQFIIEYLKQTYGDPLDSHLTKQQKAQAYLITKSLDENWYFCLVYSRWLCDDTWPIIRDTFFAGLPFPIKQIIPNLLRKKVAKALLAQGITRHSHQEILAIFEKTLCALSDLLADQPYIFGEQICSLDATLFAFIAEGIAVDIDNDFTRVGRNYPNLVSYCERIKQQYYS